MPLYCTIRCFVHKKDKVKGVSDINPGVICAARSPSGVYHYVSVFFTLDAVMPATLRAHYKTHVERDVWFYGDPNMWPLSEILFKLQSLGYNVNLLLCLQCGTIATIMI